MTNYSEIKNEIDARNIRNFVHFTPVENLRSILKSGELKTRKELEETRSKFSFTDTARLDNRKDSISLSVSRVNKRMLNAKQRNNTEFCILCLNPYAICQDFNLNFYSHNAASISYALNPYTDRSSLEYFNEMFDPNRPNDCNTKDIQAEILCFDNIPIEYIKFVLFNSDWAYKSYKETLRKHKIYSIVDERAF